MSDPAVITRCIDGAALAPLSPEQRRELVLLAKRAFDKLSSPTSTLPPSSSLPPPSTNHPPPQPSLLPPSTFHLPPSTSFDTWRHQTCLQVVERPGLTACRQEDFAPLKGHFLRLIGQEAMADRLQERAEMEPRRVALWKLEQEYSAVLDVIDRPDEYVFSIARARYKCGQIEDLSEKQIWTLLFDLRRNAQRRRRKQSADTLPKPGRLWSRPAPSPFVANMLKKGTAA
jgi:hypothetical protein